MIFEEHAAAEPTHSDQRAPADLAGIRSRFPLLLALCLGFIILADFLFWKQPVGWTPGLYGLLLAGAILLWERSLPRGAPGLIVTAALALLCASCVEDPNRLGLALGLLGLVSLAFIARQGWSASGPVWLARWLLFIAAGWVRPVSDTLIFLRAQRSAGAGRSTGGNLLRNWSLGAALSFVFLALFAAANPIISTWLRNLLRDFLDLVDALPSAGRFLMWALVGVGVWALLRFRTRVPRAAPTALTPGVRLGGLKLSPGVIVRCLILFNLVFAVQTALDVRYLWGGARLPAGMTYAEYAHRGAYPLVATALLAAVFVLAAFRGGPHARAMLAARRLVYLWLAQNIFLVVSAGWRLKLYVEVYTLTRWRVAAALWILLVVCGLAWIVVRILSGRSNLWLINANMLTALLVLYACSFADVDGFIARFNVRHCKELGGAGRSLDLAYLEALGPDALPAVLRFAREAEAPSRRRETAATVAALRAELAHSLRDPRGWTLRRRRLSRLDPHGFHTPPAHDRHHAR